jgi:hypothetical protein
MRLGQNGKRSDVRFVYADTLMQNRRWKDSTLPTVSSSWNSVSPMSSAADGPQGSARCEAREGTVGMGSRRKRTPGCNGSDRRPRAPPERGADFRVVW